MGVGDRKEGSDKNSYLKGERIRDLTVRRHKGGVGEQVGEAPGSRPIVIRNCMGEIGEREPKRQLVRGG